MHATAAQRRFYAEFIVKSAGGNDARLIDAFAQVPREDYLGPGPWRVFVGSGYLPTLTDDPAQLYQDVLIALDAERHINNGQPSLHARCLAQAAPAPGERVLHIGAGSGYYTAILATLVGPRGKVTAYEIEPDLAQRAAANLAHLPQVTVHAASAVGAALPQCDVIYVNAGATHPPAAWLDALEVGGRLVMPLTPGEGFGVMLKITRTGAGTYAASAFSRVAFIPCIGARDDAAAATLAAALERQSLQDVRSLRRGTPPDTSAWCVGHGWWLSRAAPASEAAGDLAHRAAPGSVQAHQEALVAAARAARAYAHAPYSRFAVGAAVLDEHGRIHSGCNVENAAYPQGWCAETSALAAMVAAGGRRVQALAVCAQAEQPVTPCGGCRQKLREFAAADCPVWAADMTALRASHTLGELLPCSFGPEHLNT